MAKHIPTRPKGPAPKGAPAKGNPIRQTPRFKGVKAPGKPAAPARDR